MCSQYYYLCIHRENASPSRCTLRVCVYTPSDIRVFSSEKNNVYIYLFIFHIFYVSDRQILFLSDYRLFNFFFFFIRLTWYLLPQLVLNAIRNISLQTVVQTFPNESVYAIYRMFSIENSSRYALRQIELSNYQKQQYIILYGRVGTSYTSHTVRIIPLGRSEWNLMEYNNFK